MIKIKFPKTKFAQALAIGFVSVSGATYSPSSHAMLPITDLPNLVENITANIQDLYDWAEEKSMMMLEMELESMLGEFGINNENNAMANVVVRTNNAVQDVQNLEIEEMSAPDKDARKTVALQILNNSAECGVHVGVETSVVNSLEENCQFTAPSHVQVEMKKQIVSEFVENCRLLIDPNRTLNPDEDPINKTMCVKASILTGVGTADTYTDDETLAVQSFIKLITGVDPELKKSGRFSGQAKSASLVKEMRKEAFRSLVHSSLSEVAQLRISPSPIGSTGSIKPSSISILTGFDNDRFGDSTWMSILQNANPGAKNTVMPSEVLRKMAVMDAFMVHMSVLSHKQELRMEALEAAQLALKLEPLK